jgi:signal transduction histidine kinase
MPLVDRLTAPLRRVTRLHFTRRTVVIPAIVAVLAIGAGDLATGVDLPFTLLYLVPIALGTWWRDARFGFVLACLSAGCVVTDLVTQHYDALPFVWNEVGSLIMFSLTVPIADRLRRAIEREQAERRIAIDQLRHADRLNVIGTLSAGVAHELGTPLNVITGCAEMIAETVDDARVHGHTRMILDQTRKVSQIIRQLLDFGRRRGVERTVVDLGELVSSTTAMLRSTAQKHGCSIQAVPGDPVLTTGCPGELEQVLSNLILNGVQAMARGGAVQVRTRIEHRADPIGDHQAFACVTVADRGSGIAPDDLPKIFDPFFTTKGIGEGTGLGLSVSYGIVRDHGGSIEVASEPGQGTQFHVLLPLAQASPAPQRSSMR